MTYIDKRLNYFDGQFLEAKDFNAEQAYHIDRLRRACKTALKPGIIEGLEVTTTSDGQQLTVARGVAIDAEGRQIILNEPLTVALNALLNEPWKLAKDVYVVIRYGNDTQDDFQNQPMSVVGATSGATRWLEKSEITFCPQIPPTNNGVILGNLEINQNANPKVFKDLYLDPKHPEVGSKTERVDNCMRVYADARRDEWLRLPFLPQFTTPDKSFNLRDSYLEFTSQAKSRLGIPVPPGATRIKNIKIYGKPKNPSDSTDCGTMTLYRVDGETGFGDPIINEISIEFNTDVPVIGGQLDAKTHTLTLLIEVAKPLSIYMVAVEFAFGHNK